MHDVTSPPGRQTGHAKEIGWREIVALPDLEIAGIKAKIDTGARTSALHAFDLSELDHEGTPWVAFSIQSPTHGQPIHCAAPVADRRAIKNTSGIPELRTIILTTLVIGRRHWHIEVSLSDRSEMGFDLILGRAAIRSHNIVVNPGRSFLAGPPAERLAGKFEKRKTTPRTASASDIQAAHRGLSMGEEK